MKDRRRRLEGYKKREAETCRRSFRGEENSTGRRRGGGAG